MCCHIVLCESEVGLVEGIHVGQLLLSLGSCKHWILAPSCLVCPSHLHIVQVYVEESLGSVVHGLGKPLHISLVDLRMVWCLAHIFV